MTSAISWTDMPNPKRSTNDITGRQSWYPFYPGFSSDFACWALSQLDGDRDLPVIDPWNGSGTTTAAAAQKGVSAVGFDLNPAMVVIAKSKLLDPLDVPSIRPLGRQILKAIRSGCSGSTSASDPLLDLFSTEAASSLRTLERSVRSLLVDIPEGPTMTVAGLADKLSPLAAFFYVALFRTSKQLLRGLAGTNPVWTKIAVPGRNKPRPSAERVKIVFATQMEAMLANENVGRPAARATAPAVAVEVGTSTSLPSERASARLALSSPPYCTRVDYAVATLPELSILGLGRESSFGSLRRGLIGTTTVPKLCDEIKKAWGPTCSRFLDAVATHTSRASAGYYLKSHARYFADLYTSIQELQRVLIPGGKALLVVQDSYYKEVHNDLPQITLEMATSCGFSHIASSHFPLKRLLAASNPRVRKYRRGAVTATESVIVLQAN